MTGGRHTLASHRPNGLHRRDMQSPPNRDPWIEATAPGPPAGGPGKCKTVRNHDDLILAALISSSMIDKVKSNESSPRRARDCHLSAPATHRRANGKCPTRARGCHALQPRIGERMAHTHTHTGRTGGARSGARSRGPCPAPSRGALSGARSRGPCSCLKKYDRCMVASLKARGTGGARTGARSRGPCPAPSRGALSGARSRGPCSCLEKYDRANGKCPAGRANVTCSSHASASEWQVPHEGAQLSSAPATHRRANGQCPSRARGCQLSGGPGGCGTLREAPGRAPRNFPKVSGEPGRLRELYK